MMDQAHWIAGWHESKMAAFDSMHYHMQMCLQICTPSAMKKMSIFYTTIDNLFICQCRSSEYVDLVIDVQNYSC